MLGQLRLFGMPEAEIDKARAEMIARWGRQQGAYAVHPANGQALKLFLAMASQWRTASLTTQQQSMVVRIGLDYGLLDRVAELEGLGRVESDAFRRVRLLEAEALMAWRDERERGR